MISQSLRIGFGLLLSCPALVTAMEPMNDQELSQVQGRSDMISINQVDNPGDDNVHFQRITFGMETELQTNIERFEMGIDEDGESSDTLIKDMSLGHIRNQEFLDNNPDAPRMRRADGSRFQDGEIVPFKVFDPFIEVAHEDGTGDPVGVRIGARGAQGMLIGNIKRLTGNINVDIRDDGNALKVAESEGSITDKLLSNLTPFLAGGSPLKTGAQLVQGPDSSNPGELNPKRAEYIGVPNGEKFILEDVNNAVAGITSILPGLSSDLDINNCSGFPGFGSCDVEVTAQGCEVLGIQACFDLGNFGTTPIGEQEEVDGERTITGPAEGLFISAQKRDLEYIQDLSDGNPTREDLVEATAGTFFNIPSGAVTVNLDEALNGIQRRRTEFIDRGQNLF